MTGIKPWDYLVSQGWSIVGMNHYRQLGVSHLFVAMTRGGACIKAEGRDSDAVFESLEHLAADSGVGGLLSSHWHVLPEMPLVGVPCLVRLSHTPSWQYAVDFVNTLGDWNNIDIVKITGWIPLEEL